MTDAPYQPANGTEGLDFMCTWCGRCACEPDIDPEDVDGPEGCPILTKSYALKPGEEGYPPELIERDGEGFCTAFVEDVGQGLVDPYATAKKAAAYAALPRDPVTGRPVI